MLFKNIIPMELLAQMPRSFVHRLRDLRIKQLEDAQSNQNNTNMSIGNNIISETAIEDLVDELS
jgi:hypothetical protein